MRPPKKTKRKTESFSAFHYALRLLGYRGRSGAELRERLSLKGFTHEQADEALQKLERLGYINDSALAGELAGLARQRRALGRRGAMGFLLKRGIPSAIAGEALADYDEFEGAMRTALKKLRTMPLARPGPREDQGERAGGPACGEPGKSDGSWKSKLYGALSRRGFSSSTIRQVFLKLEEEDR